MNNRTLSPPRQVGLTGSGVLLLWRSLVIEVVAVLRMWVWLWSHALHGRNMLPHYC